ncbi:Hemin uptake protein hemP [Cohaesibacter sp. ES.047]|uniref:hemin uptake protein HemP n=1 Tax=Cohaesibacter sp. ES.047 TaxID=1798205 RepID=UPI000BB6F66C|nr:hemin uptake protein HemP [Cohaesibacter sp. ES.047]SNY91273.1 Hemin uptake protein hemP [Cohaesibacter sp. ES.047]
MTKTAKLGPHATKTPGLGLSSDGSADIPTIDSRQLFADGREIQISHRGEFYRLRITAQQKLILTK